MLKFSCAVATVAAGSAVAYYLASANLGKTNAADKPGEVGTSCSSQPAEKPAPEPQSPAPKEFPEIQPKNYTPNPSGCPRGMVWSASQDTCVIPKKGSGNPNPDPDDSE